MRREIKFTLLAVAGVAALLFVVWLLVGVGVRNREASLRAQFTNVQKANQVDYDAMWKIIQQTAQVPGQYSKDFERSYSAIIASGGGTDQNAVRGLFAVAAGMKMPQLDSALYRKVQDVIESERTKFANAQKDALAIKNEHDVLRTTWPGSMYVGSTAQLEMRLVTSTRTDRAFESGKDDQTDLYGGK